MFKRKTVGVTEEIEAELQEIETPDIPVEPTRVKLPIVYTLKHPFKYAGAEITELKCEAAPTYKTMKKILDIESKPILSAEDDDDGDGELQVTLESLFDVVPSMFKVLSADDSDGALALAESTFKRNFKMDEIPFCFPLSESVEIGGDTVKELYCFSYPTAQTKQRISRAANSSKRSIISDVILYDMLRTKSGKRVPVKALESINGFDMTAIFEAIMVFFPNLMGR